MKETDKNLAFSLLMACIFMLVAPSAMAEGVDRYVSAAGTNDVENGYTSWEGASTCLQTAIDVCEPGDTVWVENGFVTDTGGRIAPYSALSELPTRILIDQAITVRSVSGDTNNPPRIVGAWDPDVGEDKYGCGPASVRCLYMATGSTLIGFMLTNGATFSSDESPHYRDQRGGGVIGPGSTTGAVLSNCVITGNSASSWGGGAQGGNGSAAKLFLYNCELSGNVSSLGVVHTCDLYNCLIFDNKGYMSTATAGTGPNCNVYNSDIWNNHSARYGGSRGSALYNCRVFDNTGGHVGGVYNGSAYNCLIIGNTGARGGGAHLVDSMYNCTIVGNEATDANRGGGVSGADYLYNCIIYSNTAVTAEYSNWYDVADAAHTCMTPLFVGEGNTDADPKFVAYGSGYGTEHVPGNYRLQSGSPCIDEGKYFEWMDDVEDVRSRDLDGQPRIRYRAVDMGAYEFIARGIIISVQ